MHYTGKDDDDDNDNNDADAETTARQTSPCVTACDLRILIASVLDDIMQPLSAMAKVLLYGPFSYPAKL
jgi:hypothetical protein